MSPKEFAKHCEAELRALPASRAKSEFLKNYYSTQWQVLGLSVPQQRQRFKEGYSLPEELAAQLPYWLELWKTSETMESLQQVLFFFDAWAVKRKRENQKRIYEPLWPHLIKMLDKIENWAHSDGLSSLIAAAIDEDPKKKKYLTTWNSHKNPWYRRHSLVDIYYYQRARKNKLSAKFALGLIKRRLEDPHFFVQRGVGWALRETSQVDKKQTLEFLKENATRLSSMAFQAAVEKIDPKDRKTLLQIRKNCRKMRR